jgi:hypothetical protein
MLTRVQMRWQRLGRVHELRFGFDLQGFGRLLFAVLVDLMWRSAQSRSYIAIHALKKLLVLTLS